MNNKRWEIAQKYEKEYWEKGADKFASGAEKQSDWHSWYAWKVSKFEEGLSKYKHEIDLNSCRVLEIGSGPIGMVTYLKWGERYAIDPLAEFYKEKQSLVKLRDLKVQYLAGTGEKIPFDDGFFNIVIIDNVLDHVSKPDLVLKEIYRVLSKNGILYIIVNIHTYRGYLLHSLLAKLNIDKGHPYSYTADKIRDFLNIHQLIVNSESVNDYYEAREADRRSESLKAKIKGYTGLSEFIYSAICLKKSD